MKSRAIALFAFVMMSLAGRASAQETYTYSWSFLSNLVVYWDNPADSTLVVDQVLSVWTLSSTLTRATVRSTSGVYSTIDFTTSSMYGWLWNRPDPLSADGLRVMADAVREFRRNRASFRPLTCSHLFRFYSGSTAYTATPLSQLRIDVASPMDAPERYTSVDDGVLTSMYVWDRADLWTSVTIRRRGGDLMNLHLVRSQSAISTPLPPMSVDLAIDFNRGILAAPHWVYVDNAYRPYGGVRYLTSSSRWTNQ